MSLNVPLFSIASLTGLFGGNRSRGVFPLCIPVTGVGKHTEQGKAGYTHLAEV